MIYSNRNETKNSLEVFYMRQSKSNRSKPITKMALFLRAMRVALWITIGFGVLISFMAVFAGGDAQQGAQEILWFITSTTLVFLLLMILFFAPVVLTELSWINRQEKHYGFKFNDEMKQLDIRGFVHMDENWLILVSGSRVYAYRKGFIIDFGIQRRSMFGKRMGSRVMAACDDGKARMISGTGATLTAITDWALGPEE
jgi:hypothetical protein